MPTTEPLLLGFPESREAARRLADCAGLAYADTTVHHFPDGESKLTLPAAGEDAAHVVLYRSLDRPHDKLIELLLASRALRSRGTRRLTLIAPYLCYMRQDVAFHPGEIISQQIIGGWLAELFDDVITVDPHLHRVSRLEEAIPTRNAIALSAAPAFVEYLQGEGRPDKAFILGPDSESEQWVRGIAEAAGLPYAIASKQRQGDRSVEITLPEGVSFAGRTVILLDDMSSTGRTLGAAAELARLRGAADVRVLVTHALFANDSLAHLRQGPITRIGSSDSILHETNAVSLAPLLANALLKLINRD
ncbi:MAG: ribose-phosphate diphosphokinase [Methylococcaceae bacterium]|jgi:ribose-phosphate pyrophosphokinase|nr:ribose-phosphate diphosphokinase [Methylococcaceae bacterium]